MKTTYFDNQPTACARLFIKTGNTKNDNTPSYDTIIAIVIVITNNKPFPSISTVCTYLKNIRRNVSFEQIYDNDTTIRTEYPSYEFRIFILGRCHKRTYTPEAIKCTLNIRTQQPRQFACIIITLPLNFLRIPKKKEELIIKVKSSFQFLHLFVR